MSQDTNPPDCARAQAQALGLTSARSKQLLARDFKHAPPGVVVRDFETLLRLIGEDGLPATPGYLLTLGNLETINRSLTHPLELNLKRAVQKSYPHINGLYLLLRASGLGVIDTQSKKPRLQLDPVVLNSWSSLNGAERYFALLRAWWGLSSDEMIGERHSWRDARTQVIDFTRRFAKTQALKVDDPMRFRYEPGYHNLALMELFGFIEIRCRPSKERKGWLPEEMRITEWGRTLMEGYADFFHRALAHGTRPEDSEIASIDFGYLLDPLECFDQWSQVIVRPLVAEWRNDLEIPEPDFQPGQYQIKVSLGAKCWRRILVDGESSVEQLASAMLQSFEFDQEHLYRVSYKSRFGETLGIVHPCMDGGDDALADEVRIGDIPLSKGMRLDFLYDFGDSWRFEILCEEVSVGLEGTTPRVLEAHGEAPSQYNEPDDW